VWEEDNEIKEQWCLFGVLRVPWSEIKSYSAPNFGLPEREPERFSRIADLLYHFSIDLKN